MKRIRTDRNFNRETSYAPRLMTQSERARHQPRDDRGRFTMIVIDEVGETSPFKEKEKKYGMAVSVTEHSELFGSLSQNHMRLQLERGVLSEKARKCISETSELKARDDTEDGKDEMIRDIKALDTKTYGFVVDKKNPPMGWKTKNTGKNALFVLDYTLDRVIPTVKGDTIVVVDNNSGYKKQAKDLIESKSDDKRVVIGNQYSSTGDVFSPQLQTHDYVANALRNNIESGDGRRTSELGMRICNVESLEKYASKDYSRRE